MIEQRGSPVTFLASFLCDQEDGHQLCLISPESGAGKTNRYLQFHQQARRGCLQTYGFVSTPGIYHPGLLLAAPEGWLWRGLLYVSGGALATKGNAS